MDKHVPGSTITKWILEDDGNTLRADVPNLGVTFTVTPADKPEERIDRVSRAFVRAITVWPPTTKGHLMTAAYFSGTVIDAKKYAVEIFMSWAKSVEIVSTTDGHGHITLDIGQDYGIRNEVTQ